MEQGVPTPICDDDNENCPQALIELEVLSLFLTAALRT